MRKMQAHRGDAEIAENTKINKLCANELFVDWRLPHRNEMSLRVFSASSASPRFHVCFLASKEETQKQVREGCGKEGAVDDVEHAAEPGDE